MAQKIKYFTILLFCLLQFSLLGQLNKLDSLYSLLERETVDSIKIKLRAEIGEEEPILRIGYWDSIRIDAEEWNLKKIKAQSINNIGVIYDNYGEEAKALEFYNEGLKIRQEIGEKHGIAESLNNLGYFYSNRGDIFNALECYSNGLKIQEDIGDSEGAALSLNNIARIYELQEDVPKALEYYQRSLKIGEDINDKNLIALELNNIGLVYYNQAQDKTKTNSPGVDSLNNLSMDYYERSMDLFKELNDERSVAGLLYNIGSIYNVKDDYSTAMEYFSKSLDICEKLHDKYGVFLSLYGIGMIYYNKRNFDKALLYEQNALGHAKGLGYPYIISNVSKVLSDIYQAQNKWKDAFEMQTLYYVMRDSINNETNRKASIKQQFKYEYEKKEAFLRADQEKERAIANEKSRKQRIVIWSSVSGFILVLLFSVIIFRSLRITRRQKLIIEIKNKETEQQKLIIEEKNKDITDSITYAKRIQNAKLPDKADIISVFPDSFVLFKPKDIVSGDFYYFHKNDKSIIIAAADCTGHGVPGAFMSMICSERLDDAVAAGLNPSEILTQVNRIIKGSLHQSESFDSTRDGMDIALCLLNPENLAIQYSGANRPLWLVRKDGSEVEEIKGTKKSIAGYTDSSQTFELHELRLQKGDTFFISSDGYADAFDGKDGKKLTTKRFKEILLEIQPKTMHEQGQYLDEFITNWIDGTVQIDDILVIGVRV